MVDHRLQQRLDDAAAERLGRRRRDRRHRQARPAVSTEPKLRLVPAIMPQPNC
jgi:hypothetical protein